MRPHPRTDQAAPDPVPPSSPPSGAAGPVAQAARRPLLIGLIGGGIQASRSPALHEAEAEALGLRGFYHLVDLDRLGLAAEAVGGLLDAAQRLGFAGVNITHPCKQAVIAHLDRLSPAAAAIGAVNTVVFEAGARIGHNTDALGFAESLRRFLPDAPMDRILQLGAGGAGAAVAHALLEQGAGEVALLDLDTARADALAAQLCARFGPGRARATTDLAHGLAQARGLVNATPIGMARYPGSPVPADRLRRSLWVADIVYTPLETELLRAARAAGCRTLSGGGMAVFQAAEAFRLFSGIAPDVARMLRHFEALSS